MWEIDNSFQLFGFLISLAVGAVYCIMYDVLRALRKSKKTDDITVFVQDILYFILISVLTFLLSMSLSNGEIRGYVIIGLAVGFAACYLTLSRITVKLLYHIFKFFGKLGDRIVDIINRFFDLVGNFIRKTVKNSAQILNKIKKIFKNHLKKNG